MKIFNYIMSAFACVMLASCMGDSYDEPDLKQSPYGNNGINEENIISIAQLKEMYKTNILTSYSYAQVTEDLKIKGVVTGNDISGNIYNEVPIQDETGAIIIAVAQGGIYGYLPVGTEIIVSLKDLYVGNYGKQAEVGVPTTNSSGSTYVGRMSRMLWNDHFKITGVMKNVEPELFADGATGAATTWNIDADGGKLGVIKNVSIRNVTPQSVYAEPSGKTSVSWYFNEFKGTSIMIYNSPYCDFASKVLPQGKCNITGIVKRYNNYWEIIIRDENDVEEL
ncbi:MAG: DUF5689 domain-containing protein [Prevotella sp.]|nr:DUF5689 domain-containing protein [Prevotella sp.]MDD6393744.1 DUF5689 domain-containing protein [Prevotella sp.]MDY2704231.1 DUF5689 domain-containing protein [Prevotella sp.]